MEPQDKLSRDQLVEGMVQDKELKARAKSNSIDNFTFSYVDVSMESLISRMTEKNFFMKMMENEEMRMFLMDDMKEEVYDRLREKQVRNCDIQCAYKSTQFKIEVL